MDLPVSGFPASVASPFVLAEPVRQSAALVLASPHSGRDYPAEFLAAARLDGLSLRRSEDSFVEELFSAAPACGAPLLAATFPRAFCDVNREPWELDPAMFEEELPPWVNTRSPRVSAGLGMIARIVSSGETIYRGKLPFAEAERRVREFWQPFHATLAALIARTQAAHGACLLVDCHSMPSGSCAVRRGVAADFVLGDAHGTTCSAEITGWVERDLADRGYAVRRNDPYAGGYITRHYGRPGTGAHVLQLEINRGLYMDESRIERTARFDALRDDLSGMIGRLAARVGVLLGGHAGKA